MGLSVLVVDDEPNIRTMLRLCLEPQHEVVEAADVGEALRQLGRADFDLAIVDLRLGDGNGLDVLRAAAGTQVVIMTAFGTIETAVQAMRDGAAEYLQKPFTAPQVTHLVERLTRQRSLTRERADLRAQVAAGDRLEVTATSDVVKLLLRYARKAAAADVTILIRGESGTGKGLLARYIHERSARQNGPFLTVDLSAITASLLESELFGHVRGAFTGATAGKAGRVESAQSGTLFLDEIGELPLPLQSKLLRLVQDREYERVGESVTRAADVRIIAATNRDLKQMVEEGTFREDLYYRLKVLELEVPALRVRREDILPLAEGFLAQAAHRSRLPVRALSAAARRILATYDWPGNVRELRNSIERAVILAEGEVADADLFAAEAEAPNSHLALEDPNGESLAAAERRHIARIIAKHPTMEEAARALGVDVVTLWRRRKKYGLQ